ncbi:NAD-dependent succinate-semialdehyde dehydrogenase [Pararhodobacter aggregans]|uniref:NAD-dependent succinate-semialdehyde dehydrogenase n=1 Tax=Pararhodobacter aggregans TaxID=404875 RepID=A0A2T7US92_9RHOB|nr:NAD-dependent succinate-semialdehyde dehydrogenase [Pararhodobacter aggregans]PTX00172.1 succinate-semialdehyde dehydrogenase/glutarate-semialdehyde dehydrogenase [Pararhodobacter aggregans]PVE47499.1 NAD-dependent succinate-semialdehyde dehydrogenase [Pararhodobacter aggregans]
MTDSAEVLVPQGYTEAELLIDGDWIGADARHSTPIVNPATGRAIGRVPHANAADLDRALVAAEREFPKWRKVSPRERGRILKRAADLLHERGDAIARLATLEMGKPLGEAKIELHVACEELEWFAEEARRTWGRIPPGRFGDTRFSVIRQPVGPAAGFSAWNFPIGNACRKMGSALAAGCPMIYKPGEEAPASALAVARCLVDAGVPAGVIAVVFGVPDTISRHLIASPVIRKISFTGSVPVGKHLIKLAAEGVKRTTMELGGHAPVLVFDDAPFEATLEQSVFRKYRNAGQVCVSPTRFYVQDATYDAFCAGFAERAKKIRVGDGLAADTQMGPLVHARRRDGIEALVQDAVAKGAKLLAGGERLGNDGFYYAPTVLADVPDEARIMSEEPFGPVAVLNRFTGIDDAIQKANALPYGLAAYAFTQSVANIHRLSDEIEAGMFGINSFNISMPETPFGGVKESGLGSEVGTEGLDAYLVTRTISVT